jgi:hypothetical protein
MEAMCFNTPTFCLQEFPNPIQSVILTFSPACNLSPSFQAISTTSIGVRWLLVRSARFREYPPSAGHHSLSATDEKQSSHQLYTPPNRDYRDLCWWHRDTETCTITTNRDSKYQSTRPLMLTAAYAPRASIPQRNHFR